MKHDDGAAPWRKQVEEAAEEWRSFGAQKPAVREEAPAKSEILEWFQTGDPEGGPLMASHRNLLSAYGLEADAPPGALGERLRSLPMTRERRNAQVLFLAWNRAVDRLLEEARDPKIRGADAVIRLLQIFLEVGRDCIPRFIIELRGEDLAGERQVFELAGAVLAVETPAPRVERALKGVPYADELPVLVLGVLKSWPRSEGLKWLRNQVDEAVAPRNPGCADWRILSSPVGEEVDADPRPQVDPVAALELREEMRRALSLLPPREARAAWLHFGLGLSESEVAKEMGVKVGTARSWFRRAQHRATDRPAPP